MVPRQPVGTRRVLRGGSAGCGGDAGVRGSWFAAVIWISAAGCDGALGEDCPAGSLFHYPLCVPEWVTHPCDEDEDDFLDDTCGGDDCGPTDPRVHPRAVEVCNGVDDDCDGFTDEG
ncbi:MAG: putative metal-binding motif-containing protein, partial [Deltaproteobacteria bacterium]|nr:putative metal-binding motif-containing protein [Deltaproteobacteria bacterium]